MTNDVLTLLKNPFYATTLIRNPFLTTCAQDLVTADSFLTQITYLSPLSCLSV